MAVNSRSFLRRVRAARPPDHDTPQAGPLAVLYLPSSARDGATLKDRLTRAGATVTLAIDLPDALQALGSRCFALVVVDSAADRSVLSSVRLVRAQAPALPIVVVTDPAYPILGSEALDA